MPLTQLPTKHVCELFHVGTLNPADKGIRGASLEGNGLSVSQHPKEWTRIAKLGGGHTFKLSNPGGRFLDFNQLTVSQETALSDWGLENAWVTPETRWKLSWEDSEQDALCFTLKATLEEALAELEDYQAQEVPASVEETRVLVLTDRATARLGFHQDPLHALSMLATFWVEDCSSLDGVWWDDELAPECYSAPRGVIVKSQLARWNAQRI